MQEFLITLIVAFILFGVFRRIVFVSAYKGFTKAQRDHEGKSQKPEGTVTIEKKQTSKDEVYTDYEEVND